MNNLMNVNTMSSKEVAELTGKEHKNVMADIRDEITKLEKGGEINELKFQLVNYTDKKGEIRNMYQLSIEGVLQLGARYDAVTRSKLITMALQPKKPKIPQTYAEALVEAGRLATELEQKEKQLEVADKRAFTSMGKLGGITKEVNRLKEEIGDGKLYKTIKAMEIKHNKKFHWKKLKDYSLEHGFEIKKISDPLYDEVNAYHVDVWKIIFGI